MVKDAHTEAPLVGATAILEGTDNGAVAGANGLLSITNIPDGEQQFLFAFVGYESHEEHFDFPLDSEEPIVVESLLQAKFNP